MRTTVEVALTLDSARHHPDTITAAVGLQPTGTLASRLNLWVYARPEVESWDVPAEVGALLEELSCAWGRVRQAASGLGIIPVVRCVVTLGRETPALSFAPRLLSRIVDLGAILDVDVHLVGRG